MQATRVSAHEVLRTEKAGAHTWCLNRILLFRWLEPPQAARQTPMAITALQHPSERSDRSTRCMLLMCDRFAMTSRLATTPISRSIRPLTRLHASASNGIPGI